MLPQKQPLELMQTAWASQLNPVIASPLLQGQLLSAIALNSGPNVINHKLGRRLVGWFPTRLSAAVTLYDTQDTNQLNQLTLNLVASAPVVVDLWVF